MNLIGILFILGFAIFLFFISSFQWIIRNLPIINYHDKEIIHNEILDKFAIFYLNAMFRLDYKCSIEDKLKNHTGAKIYIANHHSPFDTTIRGYLYDKPCFMGKYDMMNIPVVGSIIYNCGTSGAFLIFGSFFSIY